MYRQKGDIGRDKPTGDTGDERQYADGGQQPKSPWPLLWRTTAPKAVALIGPQRRYSLQNGGQNWTWRHNRARDSAHFVRTEKLTMVSAVDVSRG